MRTVRVNLESRSYDIEIGSGLLDAIGQRVRQIREVTHAVIISDSNLKEYAKQVEHSFSTAEVRCSRFEVPAGERSKSVDQASALWDQLLKAGTDRKSIVVAVGGGVVGDLAGFIAASFTRGLDFVQVPTSLLAHVDSSVGGKVGINLAGAKNMVGHFWQPIHVAIDMCVLETLPERDYRSGLAEVVKYGVILDADFFRFLENNVAKIKERDPETLAEIIRQSCRLKAYVVENDERETTGLRAILNYGHTFAHAFETVCGYGELMHGEAVSIGMLCASRLAESMGRISAEDTKRQTDLLASLGLPIDVPPSGHDQLIAAMQKDKKVEHGRLRFILPTKIGHVELVSDVEENLVRAAMKHDD
ncbi:MAG: 3-dehydroquinate synthase [Planctomycetales bacterium]|nr:3-dehydroquinate synthase [Planctomycetales bacterium]